MEQTPQQRFDEVFVNLVHEASTHDLHTEEATTAMKNLETFSKVRPPTPDPEPTPEPVPTTRLGKARAWAAAVLDNETTRAVVKAGGAFAGVYVVTRTTIKRDHIIERTAINQANQSPR